MLFLWSQRQLMLKLLAAWNKKHLEEEGKETDVLQPWNNNAIFLNNAIKESIIWPVFPLCLGIMYNERRDPCITMERGSIRCHSLSASWSKPHTSDSVYLASSTAIRSIDLQVLKKNLLYVKDFTFLTAMQIKKHKLRLLGMGCCKCPSGPEKNSWSDKQANVRHWKHCWFSVVNLYLQPWTFGGISFVRELYHV